MPKTCKVCGASEEDVPFPKARRICRECYNAREAKRQRDRRARDPTLSRRWNLSRRYNLTLEDFARLREEQDGRCAICLRERDLVVDHCHEANAVRGLLCNSCNAAIGHLNEDPRIIIQAARYVATHSELRLNLEGTDGPDKGAGAPGDQLVG